MERFVELSRGWWPIGPQYSAQSNVDKAYRYRGDVWLIVGEIDTCRPITTMQVAIN